MFLLEQKRVYLSILFLIFVVAGILRFYRLDQVPAGMNWDEAAIGYNGFSVWKVHRDEWLHFMPISFQSFGDYKAPFAIYLNGFFTLLFGLNLWAVRLPFVLAGIACIVGMSFLSSLLLKIFIQEEMNTKTVRSSIRLVVILATAIFAFSPWHLFFSRAGFESGMALNFVVWGVIFFLNSLSTKKTLKLLFIGFSVFSFVLSLYTYHSAKIFTPMLLVSLLLFFRKEIWKEKKNYFTAALFGVGLLLPLIYDSIWGKGAARLSQTSIFGSTTLSFVQKIEAFFTNYFTHFLPSFLIGGATTTLRHSDGHWGVLLITELLLVIGTAGWIIGRRFIIKDNSLTTKVATRMFLFGLCWLLIGFLPAAIGFEVPHSNRALLSYPGFVIVEMVGLFLLVFEIYSRALTPTSHSEHSTGTTLIIQSIFGMGILLHVLLAVSFFHDYFTHYAVESADAFSYGYDQAFQQVILAEPNVDKIMFTSEYGQPYIYALFFRKTSPIFYHGGSLSKYEFPDKITVGDLMRKNALVVASPRELEPSLGDSLIVAPNGEVRFVIIHTPKE